MGLFELELEPIQMITEHVAAGKGCVLDLHALNTFTLAECCLERLIHGGWLISRLDWTQSDAWCA